MWPQWLWWAEAHSWFHYVPEDKNEWSSDAPPPSPRSCLSAEGFTFCMIKPEMDRKLYCARLAGRGGANRQRRLGQWQAGWFLIYRNTSRTITQPLPSCFHLPTPPTRPFSAPLGQMMTYLWGREFTDKDGASANPQPVNSQRNNIGNLT